jgi:hypothetical protein
MHAQRVSDHLKQAAQKHSGDALLHAHTQVTHCMSAGWGSGPEQASAQAHTLTGSLRPKPDMPHPPTAPPHRLAHLPPCHTHPTLPSYAFTTPPPPPTPAPSCSRRPPPSEIVDGLRNPSLDKFLPPRKKPARWQEAQVYNPVELRYLHCPITDLGIPTAEQ